MKNQTKSTAKRLSFLILLFAYTSSAYADDSEAFFNVTPSAPNVLFLISNAESMSWDIDGQAPDHPQFRAPSRMTILQDAMRTVFENAPENINVGLMNYGESFDVIDCVPKNKKDKSCNTVQYVSERYRDYGIHGITLPITPIDDLASTTLASTAAIDNLPDPGSLTIREFIPNISDTWVGKGTAPIVDAIYEAALYFRGEKMRWGQDVPASVIASHPASYSGSPITQNRQTDGIDPATAPTYKRPITSHCQSNYIVMMSDGIPNYYDSTVQGGNGNVPGPASEFFGSSFYGALAAGVGRITSQSGDGVRGGTNPKGFAAGEGGYELVRHISTSDNDPTIDGDQTIQTFMVGFGKSLNSNEREYLETLASIDIKGTPEVEGYYSALNAEDLAKSFKEILDIISKRSISFASPGYSVNVKSGLEHEREIYVPMFDRRNAAVWPGNLKKFKINDVSGKRVIQDKNDVNATDELGNIVDTAIDLWSSSSISEPDGTDVQKGGLANLLVPAERKLFSNLDCSGSCKLNTTKNLLSEKNAENSGLIDNAILGLDGTYTAVHRKELIRFIQGLNADGTPRYHLGDMMHSEPLVITYKDDEDGKEQYIFVATNEGYLHAFDTNTGEEIFAFMPKQLLKNIKPQFSGLSAKDHVYGIDGGITYWEDEAGKKYLYFGMRRGGRAYHALDISDPANPELLWAINAEDNNDFINLGQTWSTPYLARVGVDGATKEVLIVSGGYDDEEDRDLPNSQKLEDATKTVTPRWGNDIFIIDALSGDRIWSLQSDTSISNRTDLASTVPGGLRMLDTNYNNLVDRLYFADTGGFVWRLDLSEKIGDSAHPTRLTKFADLGDVDNSDARKFYNEPDVSLMKLNGHSVFVVSIGSGFRAHPLDKTLNDNFYMLLDKSPYGVPDPDEIVDGDLATIEISGVPGATTVTQPNGIMTDTGKKGWKVILPENGEKSLSTALGFDGVMTFTTLIPEELQSVLIDECDPPATHGRFYAINVLTGEAGLDLNGDGTINDADLTITVTGGDFPPSPTPVFNPLTLTDVLGADGLPTGDKTCAHPVDIRIGKKLSQATGYDACRLESVYWGDPVKTLR